MSSSNDFTTTNTEQFLGRYRVVRTLGSGMLKVKLVCDPTTGMQYAAKICKSNTKKAALENEAALLRDLNKANIPNIISLIEYIDRKALQRKTGQLDCQSSQSQYKYKSALIMELAPNETLFDIIYHNGKLEEKLARTYFKKLVETVGTLHQKGFVHRDLKSENILLDENFQLKVADFGFSREFNEFNKDKMKTKLGTDTYMAPELNLGLTYSGVKTDSFACGVLLFIMVFGRPPFFKASSSDPYYKNFAHRRTEKFWQIYETKMKRQFDSGLKTLISDLLQNDPDDRVDVGDTWDYEWMKGEVYSDEELVEVVRPLREVVEQGNKSKSR